MLHILTHGKWTVPIQFYHSLFHVIKPCFLSIKWRLRNLLNQIWTQFTLHLHAHAHTQYSETRTVILPDYASEAAQSGLSVALKYISNVLTLKLVEIIYKM
jgi:hypothetical protein